MQRKLKSVFRRSSKSRRTSDQNEQIEDKKGHTQTVTPSGDQRRVSSGRRGGNSTDSSATGSVYTGRSRPISSIYEDRQNHVPTKPTSSHGLASTSETNGGAIANDYKSYLPALSSANGHEYNEGTSFNNGATLKHNGGSGARHEEDIADRNVERYSPSTDEGQRNPSAATSATAQQLPKEKPVNHVLSQTESSSLTKDARMRSDAAPAVQEHTVVQHATIDGTAHGEESALARKLRESGVADLRNTVDTDGDVTWAPAVTHEVVKPHRHEIVQHKIYREIHNYEHFHRIQPVMMTEVLPPRHWIPNPDGEGLIEISADELPARTGENRWWSVCEHSSPYSLQTSTPKYRTEPEIIDAGTYITKEGFERKETIIIHPPTLADLTGYGGPVQAMHFDHKTGKSWMGELTTMDKLQQLQQELDRAPDVQAFRMDGLANTLPTVSPASVNKNSSSIPIRKPVQGQSSIVNVPSTASMVHAI
ncbi:hypothetical protein E8E13_002019 [Curvularia kusanoi]|uniref:Uncharacterized protein n=1 Tax=Curvularia kusanoi TaxID=90978 RepID=A0A9P4W7P6_CURKU|nr:hypothetical protein E8E13_002019 [Curvularia kusanoi]